MPMPIDLLVEYTDGTRKVLRTVTNDELRKETISIKRTVLNDWTWAQSTNLLLKAKKVLSRDYH
jgi:hypothetical protein